MIFKDVYILFLKFMTFYKVCKFILKYFYKLLYSL